MPRNDALWTDYDGDEPYVDHLVNAVDGQPVNQRRYLPGLGHVDDITGTTAYVHGDQVGTLRLLTDGVTGATLLRRVFSAFGEQALSEGTGASRYGYAGAFGYESFGFADLPFIHVGERWYDPSSGRFLQRDPIGIRGGLNTFNYLHANPASGVDPKGLFNDLAFGPLLPPNWQPGGLTSLPTPPPPPVGPPWPLPPVNNEVDSTTFLDVTGGRDSWLDRPTTVKWVRIGLTAPAVFLSCPFLPMPFHLQVVLWVGDVGLVTIEAIEAWD